MSQYSRTLFILGLGLLLGVAANFLFGPSPATMDSIAPVKEPWVPLSAGMPDLAAADASWEARAPWGAPPKPVETEVPPRSEEHTSELQSLMRISSAVFCL